MASGTSSPSDMAPTPPLEELLDTPGQPKTPFEKKPGRLGGMLFIQRVGLANLFAMGGGFVLGSTQAGRMAGLRYRAENAHRLPTTTPGWYLYHKTKNYVRMKDGIQAGMKLGFRLVGWTTMFFLIEESMDVFRGTWRAGRTLDEMEGVDELDLTRMAREIENSRNFVSTSVAGMVSAGLYSAWNHLPAPTAARTIRLGLLMGLAYGLTQDGLTWYRVNKHGYPEESMWKALEEKAAAKKRSRQQTSGDEIDLQEQKSW